MQLTLEQQQIVEAVKLHNRMRVNAYAGTGKTTTLRAIAKAYPSKRVLFLAFNNSVAKEINEKKPQNMTASTIHSLAYQFTARRLKNMKIETGYANWMREVQKHLSEKFNYISFLRDVFIAFCNSEYTEPTTEVISDIITKSEALTLRSKFVSAQPSKLAEHIAHILDKTKTCNIPATHDSYLKLFHMQLQDYAYELNKYDIVLVDEAQDLNPVQEAIIRSNIFKRVVVVGDRHQSIYSWRGAINTLNRLQDWYLLNLTHSFRFQDNKIVELANRILYYIKHDDNQIKMMPVSKTDNRTAYIARTNASLLEIIAVIDRPFYLNTQIDQLEKQLRKAQAVLNYMKGLQYDNTKLDSYTQSLIMYARETRGAGFEQFIKFLTEEVNEQELARSITFVEKTKNVDSIIEKIKKLNTKDADLVFTTAHSAKGLEYRDVVIMNDFPHFDDLIQSHFTKSDNMYADALQLIANNDESIKRIVDEINLQYVAITRAISSLMFSEASENKIMQNLYKSNLMLEAFYHRNP